MNKKAYENNIAFIYLYKSTRKNSKVMSDITIRHLIPTNGKQFVDDNSILNYFISTVEKACYTFIKCKSINTRYWISYGHETHYINANNERYEHITMLKTMSQRDDYSSFEMFINHLYRLFLVIYPYTKLDIKTIYDNPSIRYYITEYYKKHR